MGQYISSVPIFFCALLHSLLFAKCSAELDRVFHNQTIIFHGQTLISPNRMFEMGFFSPGLSGNRFLGVWCRNTPDVIVWVGNRNHPVKEWHGLRLAVVGSGDLAILSYNHVVWSANSSGLVLKPTVQLLDTGNLVVSDQSEDGSQQTYKWQSFDHPTDTLLPGMKIVDDVDVDAGVEKYLTSWKNFDDPSTGDFSHKISNKGLPDIVTYRGTRKIYRSGVWNGIHFSGTPPFPTQFFNPEMVFKGERLASMSMIYNASTFTRLNIDKSGYAFHWALSAQKDKWNLVYVTPQDRCHEYGKCGPFGICTIEGELKCECLKGFTPKIRKDWDLLDWSSGCVRITPLDCHSEDHGFEEIIGVKYPDMLQFGLNTSMSLNECRAACLRNCNCTAFANPYITDGRSSCLIWFGELIDTRFVPGSNSKQKIYIRLPASEVASSSNLGNQMGDNNMPNIWFVLISVLSGVLISGFINGCIHYMARKERQANRSDKDLDLPLYKLSTILSATDNFSQDNLIGEGGFGPVYWGNLSTHEQIAVKRLTRKSGQGFEEFKNEITLIVKLQHRNLVQLLGCCIEREERILIYEYLQNKSLDTFIFDTKRKMLLTWPKRLEIIVGIARGLLYLHHDSRFKIIHRDLKTSNILLDGSLTPKISDFGLARTFKEDQPVERTKTIAGTYGYMSPEYTFAGKFSMKSDIFSLGVVLLEIVSGIRNKASLTNSQYYYSLLGHAWLLWKETKTLELMDECLKNTFDGSQVKRCVQIGLLCVQKHPEDRPNIISLHSMLCSEEGILPEPAEPGFFIEKNFSVVQSNLRSVMEHGTMSISDVEAR